MHRRAAKSNIRRSDGEPDVMQALEGMNSPIRLNQSRWVAAWLCCFLLPMHAALAKASDDPRVKTVRIESKWMGLNPMAPFETTLTIDVRGSSYRMQGTISHFDRPPPGKGERVRKEKPVDMDIAPSIVTSLLHALLAPTQANVTSSSLGVSDDMIQQAIDKQWKDAELDRLPSAVHAIVERARTSLRAPAALQLVLSDGLQYRRYDDYPYVSITLVLDDGHSLHTHSGHQLFRMLPWSLDGGRTTWNPALPEAIAALLPDGSANRTRLNEPTAESQLEELLGNGLADTVSRLRTEAFAMPAWKALRQHFVVESVATDGAHHRAATQLDVTLRRGDSPRNLSLDARLRLIDGALAQQGTIQDLDARLRLAQGSQILARRMATSPDTPFRMRLGYPDTVPSRRLWNQFVDQMHMMKRLSDVTRDSALRRPAVLVEEGSNPIYWVVLPDGRTVRWKEATGSARAQTQPCQAVPMYGEIPPIESVSDQCEGVVYNARGIESR